MKLTIKSSSMPTAQSLSRSFTSEEARYRKANTMVPMPQYASRISSVSEINENDTVSYGRNFRPKTKIKKAVVSIGYADGLSRILSGKATLRINGCDCPVIGNICMDLCVVDVTDVECAVGDEVIVFENNSDILRLASLSSTINYEIVCSVKNRVPRRYI